MAVSHDPVVQPLLEQLAGCLCKTISDSSLPEPCFCGIVPGAVAYDYCQPCGERCGMAYVTVTGITPLQENIPRSSAARSCHVQMQVTIGVGIIRCAPQGGDYGAPPTMEAQLAASQLQMDDMYAARRAIMCCFDGDYSIGGWTPVGPEGGCLGGEWTVIVDTD
jgi:hypothetical protein